MKIPRFLIGDNTETPDDNFVIHTEYPRFIINLVNDEIEWLEDFSVDNEDNFTNLVAELIDDATAFYDREMERYKA